MKTLFVHLDKIGGLQEKSLRALQNGVVQAWTLINQAAKCTKDYGGEEAVPRIYFYLSGKGIPLLELGRDVSSVSTAWIILDELGQQHINKIRAELVKIEADESLDKGVA